MFADKSSSRPPTCRRVFPSPLSSPADSSPFPLASSEHPALNNKYERVLREYPEGAISGVQARTLSHTSKPTRPPFSLSPPVVFGFFHDSKRESNTLRGETRGALWKKGEGPSDRFMETARLSFFSMFLLFLLFLNSLAGRRTNDWLEIYEKDRKIIPFAGDSEREKLEGGASNVWDINGGASRYLARCKLPCRKTRLHVLNLVKDVHLCLRDDHKNKIIRNLVYKTYYTCEQVTTLQLSVIALG